MKKIRVGIVGASGYSGAELVRLLSGHPMAEAVVLTAETYAGQPLNRLYPGLGPAGSQVMTSLADSRAALAEMDLIFFALPHGEAAKLAPGFLETGRKVIDLSGDFRFPDPGEYEQWYHSRHPAPRWARAAVYGLPELFREHIPGAQLIANPGCYATTAVLALAPVLKAGWVEPQSLVVDAKSGVSGAGRKASLETGFNRVSENFALYKMAGTHQHTPEMENTLRRAVGTEVRITFSPQLIPARRGILAVVYGRLRERLTGAEATRYVQTFYDREPFVEVWDEGRGWPDLACTVGSNRCVLRVAVDERTQTLVAAASLDNLIKGAAGQAVQNMNLLFGFPETTGLPVLGMLP